MIANSQNTELQVHCYSRLLEHTGRMSLYITEGLPVQNKIMQQKLPA